MQVWICGQLLGEWKESDSAWAFQGVFSSRGNAVAACRDGAYFIFSAQLDDELPHESLCPPDAEYPTAVAETWKG